MTKLAVFLLVLGGIAPALFLEGAYLFASAGGPEGLAAFNTNQPSLADMALLFGGICFLAGVATFVTEATIESHHEASHSHSH